MNLARKRLGLGVIDQILSGASNILIIFALARVSSVEEFGAISLAIAAVMASVLLCRGLLGTPITLLSGKPLELQVESRFALSVAIGIGAVLAIGMIAGSQALAIGTWPVTLVALSAPAILAQDCGRFLCIASGRPVPAVASDGLWALGSAGLFLFTILSVDTTPTMVILCWFAFAVLSAILIHVLARNSPNVRGLHAWISDGWSDRARYGGEAGLSAANGTVFLAVAGLLVGASSIASLRGAGSVMGPLNILLASIPLVMVSEIRRTVRAEPTSRWPLMLKVAYPMSLIAITVGFGSIIVPDRWGAAILGETWYVAQPLLPITGIEYVGLTFGVCAQAILKIKGDSSSVLLVRVVHCTLIIFLTVVASVAFGTAISIAVGLAAASLAMAAFAISRSIDRRGLAGSSPR